MNLKIEHGISGTRRGRSGEENYNLFVARNGSSIVGSIILNYESGLLWTELVQTL